MEAIQGNRNRVRELPEILVDRVLVIKSTVDQAKELRAVLPATINLISAQTISVKMLADWTKRKKIWIF